METITNTEADKAAVRAKLRARWSWAGQARHKRLVFWMKGRKRLLRLGLIIGLSLAGLLYLLLSDWL